jgi:ankyrin repeat protein
MEAERRSRQWLLAAGLVAVVAVAVAAWWFSPGQQHKRRNAAIVNAARAGDVKAIEVALDAGADVNAPDGDGITPLMHAVRGDRPKIAKPGPSEHPEVVELLIKRGAAVNARTDSGFVALFWAARYGHAGVAKVLIAQGAEVNVHDKGGMTALKWATTNQQAKVVKLLKDAGAKE